MIDYWKVLVYKPSVSILINSYLCWTNETDSETGEGSRMHTASFGELKFVYYEEAVVKDVPATALLKIQGSLHKHYNYLTVPLLYDMYPKGFNGDLFKYSQLVYVLNDIENRFNISLDRMILRNLEVGVNSIFSMDVKPILNGLLMHKGKPFLRSMRYYKQSTHDQFWVKCYDKGRQYGLNDNVFRYELKWSKMEQLNKIGIRTTLDLLDKSKLGLLKSELLKRWEEVLFFDSSLNNAPLQHPEQLQVAKFSNVNYWTNLKPNRRDRPTKKLDQLTKEYALGIKDEVGRSIANQFDHLLSN